MLNGGAGALPEVADAYGAAGRPLGLSSRVELAALVARRAG
jgi:hypothetical protein